MVELLEKKLPARILASHHNFVSGHTLGELTFYAAKAHTLGAQGLKLALMFQTDREEQDLYQFIGSEPPLPLMAAFGMGERGKASRVLGPLLGAPLTYGFAGNRPAAPGQWPLAELRKALDMFLDQDLNMEQLLKLL